jgi:hypothetical protein
VTLAEAMTRIAFGGFFASDVLMRFRRRHRRFLPPATEEALDAVGAKFALLAYDGELVLRGERQDSQNAPLHAASNIPREIFADGVHFEPSRDVIEMDLTLDRHFAGLGYPLFRHVRLDRRQIAFERLEQSSPSREKLPPRAERLVRGYAAADTPLIEEMKQTIEQAAPELDQIEQPAKGESQLTNAEPATLQALEDAEKYRKSKSGAATGGRKSGETRRRKAACTWQPPALELAQSIRTEKPSLSQDDVVEELQARWKLANTRPPGTRSLKTQIARWEREGKLPRRRAGSEPPSGS